MRAVPFSTAFAFLIALSAAPAGAADKPAAAEKSAKAEKTANADKKPAAGAEVTLSGEMVCAKCTLHEAKKCQNVLKVTEGGKETKYYLAQNEIAKSNVPYGRCPIKMESRSTKGLTASRYDSDTS